MHENIFLAEKPASNRNMPLGGIERPWCAWWKQSVAYRLLKWVATGHTHMFQMTVDGLIFAASFALACLVYFGGVLEPGLAGWFFSWLVVVTGIRLFVNQRAGVYHFLWRFVCLSDVVVISGSLFAVTSGLTAMSLLYPSRLILASWIRVPPGILGLEFLLSLSVSLSVRAARRIYYERSLREQLGPGQTRKRVLLYGAGRAGIQLVRELSNHAEIDVVGFVDDDPRKLGTVIAGTRVMGDGQSLKEIVARTHTDELVISIATAEPKMLTEILSRSKQISIPAKIIPTLSEIIRRKASISHVRDIRIEDLLGRGSVVLKEFDEDIHRIYGNRRVLVTGGAGSIGSELVRQLELLDVRSIIVLDKDENSVYDLEQEMKLKGAQRRIEPVIADIRDAERLLAVFDEYRPQMVFHAAAHKHVPLMEKHPCEAVLNNIGGIVNVLEASRHYGVERFVFISSDKAVNPTNVMGATKRLGELLVQDYAKTGQMRMACVRFGNVMGSRGSVIPLFRKQIERGGPITITHPEVVRFFMTIPEASQLVLCAGSLADRAEVFALDMGSPRKILDLAQEMIRLCGLTPDKDIRIEITGLRPGEKMFEELVRQGERVSPTRFAKISKIENERIRTHATLLAGVWVLIDAARRNDHDAVREVLASLDLGFSREWPIEELAGQSRRLENEGLGSGKKLALGPPSRAH